MADLLHWEVEALTFGEVLSTGRTKPLTFGCIGRVHVHGLMNTCTIESDVENDFVVKICGCNEMTDKCRVYEFIAAMLGQALDVPVVEPAIVTFTPEILPMVPEPQRTALKASNGRQFGSKYLGSGWAIYPNGKLLEDCLIDQALGIYVFDLLIQNVDRRIEKPNVLTNGKELRAYDHEKAFTFLVPPLGTQCDPWQVRHYDWAKNHIFFKLLKGKKLNLDTCIERIRFLDNEIFDQIGELLPKEWMSTELDSIASHILGVKQNIDFFSAELIEVLS